MTDAPNSAAFEGDHPVSGGTVDASEVERFSRMATEWWSPTGKFKPLHKFNPVRLAYLKRKVSAHFGKDPNDLQAFSGLRFLDIGCGGGLLSEPMARLGAEVTGVDPSRTNIEVAKLHADLSNLTINYRATTAEALEAEGETFDVVLAMEVVEHVADVEMFLSSIARMVRPGGLIVVATINRTLKAYGLAIFGAEVVLRWLPRGTHSYEKLVKPSEVEIPLLANGLHIMDKLGVSFNPLLDKWSEGKDLDVNYMILAGRPQA